MGDGAVGEDLLERKRKRKKLASNRKVPARKQKACTYQKGN